MEVGFKYSFPAIRGIQAKREYYISMCPLYIVRRFFAFDDVELKPEIRAQRILNKSRIPEITRYILGNPDSYIFSALTVSVDGDMRFEPVSDSGLKTQMGTLHVSMEAKFIVNDGQHRRAAIIQALQENPDLGDETIAVVFFLDIGLERCQQMFADLNRYAIRPSRSLGVLYDHRDYRAKLAKQIVLESPVFRDVVEMERSSLSARSKKLFTLSAIYSATSALLNGRQQSNLEKDVQTAVCFWEEVAKQFPEWQMVRNNKITAGEVRSDYLHSHGVILQALGNVGNYLLDKRKTSWKNTLKKLRKIDWSRSNKKQWEGRALSAGRVSKAGQHISLTTNRIKTILNLPLSVEEQRIENNFKRAKK